MEIFVFSVEKTSLSHMKQRAKQAIQSTSTQTLQKMWKRMNATASYVAGVNGGRNQQDNKSVKSLKYFHDSAY